MRETVRKMVQCRPHFTHRRRLSANERAVRRSFPVSIASNWVIHRARESKKSDRPASQRQPRPRKFHSTHFHIEIVPFATHCDRIFMAKQVQVRGRKTVSLQACCPDWRIRDGTQNCAYLAKCDHVSRNLRRRCRCGDVGWFGCSCRSGCSCRFLCSRRNLPCRAEGTGSGGKALVLPHGSRVAAQVLVFGRTGPAEERTARVVAHATAGKAGSDTDRYGRVGG